MACVDSKCSVFRFSLLAQMSSDVYNHRGSKRCGSKAIYSCLQLVFPHQVLITNINQY